MDILKRVGSPEAPKLFSVLVDQVLLSATTLLTSVVLARTYDKADYADLVLLFSISMFVLGFQSSLISKPYAISLNDFKGENLKRYFYFNLNLKFLFTLLLILFFPLMYFVLFDTWSLGKAFFFVLYVSSYTSYYFVRETLLSERKTLQNLKYGAFCSIVIVIVLSVILFCQIRDVSVFLCATSVIYLIATFVYLLGNRRFIKIDKKHYLRYWKINWSLGKWLTGSNILFHMSTNIYPWLLLFITSKNDVAVYGVLMSVASLLNPVLAALSSYLLPIFVKMNTDYGLVKQNLNRWVAVFGVMSITLVFIGYFFGQLIIDLVFGGKYAALGIIVIFPYVVQAINIISQPFRIALNAIKRTDINFWILIPRSIISITVGIVLVRSYGVIGVFYTMVIENIFYQSVYYIIYRKIINKPIGN
ncbi:MAG: polysaccharide biosynthesis protein [Maribacter sp.]|nr:MAG: polysaccharide biosynthesis protein [Maribacter sp.]